MHLCPDLADRIGPRGPRQHPWSRVLERRHGRVGALVSRTHHRGRHDRPTSTSVVAHARSAVRRWRARVANPRGAVRVGRPDPLRPFANPEVGRRGWPPQSCAAVVVHATHDLRPTRRLRWSVVNAALNHLGRSAPRTSAWSSPTPEPACAGSTPGRAPLVTNSTGSPFARLGARVTGHGSRVSGLAVSYRTCDRARPGSRPEPTRLSSVTSALPPNHRGPCVPTH